MSLENQVTRVSQGAKDTLKALINMMGGNITDELIDQYPAIASQLLPPTGITGNTVTVTAKEQLDAGNMIIILQNGDGYDAYKATTEGVATSNFWLGIAKNTVLANATADVISIAYMEASSDFVVEQNKGNEQKFWVGTEAEYRAIETKDPNTLYVLTDEEGSATSYVTQGEFIALSQAVDGKADLVDGKVPTEQLPKANGLYMPDGTTTIKEAFDAKADLGEDGKVPASQLPDISSADIPITSTPADNVKIWIDPNEDDQTENFYTKVEINSLLQKKADSSSVYTKTESDSLLQKKADTTKKASVVLSTNWTGSASPYTQSVTISGATANSKVDLQPDASVIAQMVNDGTVALYIANDNGTLTAYAVGEKPTVALTIQATIMEVRV